MGDDHYRPAGTKDTSDLYRPAGTKDTSDLAVPDGEGFP
jgi:hypothetical protein